MRGCAWMCFGVFSMGYFLALSGSWLLARGIAMTWHQVECARSARRGAATAAATSPLLWSCGMPAVCVFGGGVHVPIVRLCCHICHSIA